MAAAPREYRMTFSLLAPDRILASYDNGRGTELIECDASDFFAPIRADEEFGISRALLQFFLLGGYEAFAADNFAADAKARTFRFGAEATKLHPEGIRANADGTYDVIVRSAGAVRAVQITPEQVAGYTPSIERAFANARTWAAQAGFSQFSNDLLDALNARAFWG